MAGKSHKETDPTKLLQELIWLKVRKLICLDLGISMFKIEKVMSLKPFSKCLDTMITHITPEVLPLTIFLLNMAYLSIGKTTIWNSMPWSIKQSESLESFKNNFKCYLMLTESFVLV